MYREVILATFRDNNVSLRLPDGSAVEVPRDTISRSAVLRQTIPEAITEEEVQLTLPSGVVGSWLQCAATMKRGLVHMRPAVPFSDAGDELRLPTFLKVIVSIHHGMYIRLRFHTQYADMSDQGENSFLSSTRAVNWIRE